MNIGGLFKLKSEEQSFAMQKQARTAAGMRVLDSEYKLRQNIKIAMLYLEDDDSINAELFIKKASSLIAASKVCF